MKRYLALFLAILLLLPVLAACVQPGEDPNDGTTAPDHPEESTTDDTVNVPPSPPSGISLEQIGSYDIVVPTAVTGPVYQKANALLSAFLGTEFGKTVELKKEPPVTSGPAYKVEKYEILIGDTTRPESDTYRSTLRLGDYGYGIVKDKIVISAHDDENLIKAIELFINDVVSKESFENNLFLATTECKTVPGEYAFDNVTVAGASIDNFVIVYPKDSTGVEQTYAEQLRQFFLEELSFVVPVISDATAKRAGSYEILIGVTNRSPAIPSTLKNSESYLSITEACTQIAGDVAGKHFALQDFYALFGEPVDRTVAVEAQPSALRTKNAKNQLKVMSYNILTYQMSGTRKERVLTMIKNYDPDIIGMQEVNDAWVNYFRGELDEYTSYGIGRNADGSAEMNKIYFKTSKFTLLDAGDKWLTPTPDVKGSIIDGSKYIRMFSYVLLQRKSDGEIILFVNTHLDNSTDAIRLKQAEYLTALINEIGSYTTFVTGDYNTTPGSPSYDQMLKEGFLSTADVAVDAYRSGTYHGYSGANAYIDYCYVRAEGAFVAKYRVCNEKINGDFASDHHPIYTEIYIGD